MSPSLSQPQPRSESFIYFNYFFNIPHLMMQIPLSSLSVNVLIQIFLLIVHSTAVVLTRGRQPAPFPTPQKPYTCCLHPSPGVFSWLLPPSCRPSHHSFLAWPVGLFGVCVGLVWQHPLSKELDTGLSLHSLQLKRVGQHVCQTLDPAPAP